MTSPPHQPCISRAFKGEDVSLTLSAVLQREPDWALSPPNVPPGLPWVGFLASDELEKVSIVDGRLVTAESVTASLRPPRPQGIAVDCLAL